MSGQRARVAVDGSMCLGLEVRDCQCQLSRDLMALVASSSCGEQMVPPNEHGMYFRGLVSWGLLDLTRSIGWLEDSVARKEADFKDLVRCPQEDNDSYNAGLT